MVSLKPQKGNIVSKIIFDQNLMTVYIHIHLNIHIHMHLHIHILIHILRTGNKKKMK